jgi:hypothetical protein
MASCLTGWERGWPTRNPVRLTDEQRQQRQRTRTEELIQRPLHCGRRPHLLLKGRAEFGAARHFITDPSVLVPRDASVVARWASAAQFTDTIVAGVEGVGGAVPAAESLLVASLEQAERLETAES